MFRPHKYSRNFTAQLQRHTAESAIINIVTILMFIMIMIVMMILSCMRPRFHVVFTCSVWVWNFVSQITRRKQNTDLRTKSESKKGSNSRFDKFQNGEHRNLYFSRYRPITGLFVHVKGDGIRHIARLAEIQNAYKNLIRTPDRKSSRRIPGRRWEAIIGIGLCGNEGTRMLTGFIWLQTGCWGGHVWTK